MTKLITSKMCVRLLVLSMLAYAGCKEKETAVPTVDYARVDALRAELRSLQQQMLGANANNAATTATNAALKSDTTALKAEIARFQAEKSRKVKYIVYV